MKFFPLKEYTNILKNLLDIIGYVTISSDEIKNCKLVTFSIKLHEGLVV